MATYKTTTQFSTKEGSKTFEARSNQDAGRKERGSILGDKLSWFDPFSTFTEWAGDADEKAYADL